MISKLLTTAAVLAAIASISGCPATVGSNSLVSVPNDAATTCTKYCTDMGLTLDAVVVMANNVGCVCAVPGHATARRGSTAAAGAMSAVVEEERQRATQKR